MVHFQLQTRDQMYPRMRLRVRMIRIQPRIEGGGSVGRGGPRFGAFTRVPCPHAFPLFPTLLPPKKSQKILIENRRVYSGVKGPVFDTPRQFV
ncbi:hypothetical protein [Bacteriophage sp.]|nr:hypothetical protein [Bacteriophage sp.]